MVWQPGVNAAPETLDRALWPGAAPQGVVAVVDDPGTADPAAGAEALLRAGFDAAPTAIGVFSLQADDFGRLLRVNPAACRFFGRPRDDLLTLRWQEVIPEEDRGADETAVRALLEAGRQVTGHLQRFVHADGGMVWGRMHMTAVSAGAGHPTLGLAQIEDVTASVARDEALRRNEELQAAMFEQSPVAMALVDLAPATEGMIAEANPAYARLMGRRVDEVVGAIVDDFTHPEDRGRMPEARAAMKADGCIVKRYVRPDGSVRFAELRARPISEDGESRFVMATLVDITDRVQAQQARETIIEAALDAIVAIDGQGAITVFNAAAERIFGHRAEDVLGRPLAEMLIPPESRATHLDGVKGVQENRLPLTGATTRVTAMRADGSRFPVDLTVRRTGGDPAEFTAFVHDLTEHARAERRQRDAEQLFHSVFADSAVAMAVQNVNGAMVEVNDELCRFLGRTRGELVGADPAAFTHPDDVIDHDELFATLIAVGAEGVRDEKRYIRSDGVTVAAFVHASLIRDESGRPRGIQLQLVDITASQRTKEQLEAVLNSLAEGVIALDGEHRCVALNPAAETLLGYSEADLVGRPLADFVGLPGLEPLEGVTRDGAPVRVEDEEFRRSDGTALPVAYSASPLELGERRGVVVVFSDVSERKAREQALRTRLEAFDVIEDIRAALGEDRLVLHSQPIRNLATGVIDQGELLLRMVGRDGELIPPGRFLPVAEEYGLIADIDRWVIGRAAEIAATGRHVEVNVSGATLGERDLVYWVEEALATTGADPCLMTFEITETALTNDLEQASRFAEHVAALGCGFALDDFGTGYGSFTLLKRLPVSYLKIDMEFVRDLVDDDADRHVVGAVIALAKGLGMRTIAEGIEEPETLALLTEMGVDFGQGYLIGRPAPLELAA